MKMSRFLRNAPLLAAVMVLLSQGGAQAGGFANVNILSTPSPGSYSPNPATPPGLGAGVSWTNTTVATHTATGDAPLSYFDTGFLSPTQSAQVTFPVAGSYPYHCSIHSEMHGTVNLPMVAAPSTGTAGVTQFGISWASSIPVGYNVDIQFRRNGGAWRTLFANRTGSQTEALGMVANPGTYDVRARIQRSSTGAASGYSPPVTIVVTA